MICVLEEENGRISLLYSLCPSALDTLVLGKDPRLHSDSGLIYNEACYHPNTNIQAIRMGGKGGSSMPENLSEPANAVPNLPLSSTAFHVKVVPSTEPSCG
jgi:hypothetical protein